MIREYRSWLAMNKFANDCILTEEEWEDLSALSMINREKLYFGPGNVRWAKDEEERLDNLRFYKSL